jgi:hypothetical protein
MSLGPAEPLEPDPVEPDREPGERDTTERETSGSDLDRSAEPASAANPNSAPEPATPREEQLDVDATFAALVAGWNVDTTHALIEAERELNRENPQWRAEVPEPTYWPDDHYEPPAPPPFPRLHPRTVLAMCLLGVSIALIVLGTGFGYAFSFCLALGVIGVIGATALFLSRLRGTNDEDDDGAHV